MREQKIYCDACRKEITGSVGSLQIFNVPHKEVERAFHKQISEICLDDLCGECRIAIKALIRGYVRKKTGN